MADQNCELCHERPGHAIADAWLCDTCEKIMDPDVMAFYGEQNKADQASLMARLGAAERERDQFRKEAIKGARGVYLDDKRRRTIRALVVAARAMDCAGFTKMGSDRWYASVRLWVKDIKRIHAEDARNG